jgi:hypothetical protein
VQGHLSHSFEKEHHGYTCKIFNICQLSNNAAKTIKSKSCFEAIAQHKSFNIKAYHTDNGIFAPAAFKNDCTSKHKQLTFSGVTAHNQNGVVKQNIKTILQGARASLLHAAHLWPEHANIKLWPLAVDYAVWVFNCLPSVDVGLSPNTLWSQAKCSHKDFNCARVFECPIYILDPKMQDGHKILKWDPQACLGMFVGFSSMLSLFVLSV